VTSYLHFPHCHCPVQHLFATRLDVTVTHTHTYMFTEKPQEVNTLTCEPRLEHTLYLRCTRCCQRIGRLICFVIQAFCGHTILPRSKRYAAT
jgi:hypothetical protein